MVGAGKPYEVRFYSNDPESFLILTDLIRYVSNVDQQHDLKGRPLVLDKSCMFTVFSERDGKPWTHSVKPLQIIWNHFPQ